MLLASVPEADTFDRRLSVIEQVRRMTSLQTFKHRQNPKSRAAMHGDADDGKSFYASAMDGTEFNAPQAAPSDDGQDMLNLQLQ